MEIKTIVTVIIAGMLGAVVFAGLLPAFVETASAEDTFTNSGKWRMAPNTNGDVYTYDNTDKTWSLNGVVVNSENNSSYNAILLDNLVIRTNGWIRGAEITGNSVTTVVTNANDQTVITGNGLSGNGTYSIQGYGINPAGDYVLTEYDNPVYMKGDSPIYATGVTAIASIYDAIIHITGNIDDGVTVTASVLKNSPYTITDVTISDLTVNYEEVDNYEGLYLLKGITFNYSATATNNNTEEVTTITNQPVSYSSYVVPLEVTAEKSIHPDGPTTALLNLLPVLIAIGLIMGIAGAIFVKRM